MIMICTGKFGQTAPHEDEALDIQPKSDNQNANKSDGSMSDGSAGFPMGEIFEANSDDE